ncbi:MAG: AAA family ATPase [Planctomycetes bacterium]|nr:AAA family ATPase [Planctomycetota bacterium]
MPRPHARLIGLDVRGFKSIREKQHIEVRPLTLLAGANCSGKSSMMQPLLLMKQTLESAGDPGALLLDGPNVRFTSAEQLLSGGAGVGRASSFECALYLSASEHLMTEYAPQREGGFGITRMIFNNDEWRQSMTSEAIQAKVPKDAGILEKSVRWVVTRDRCFLSLGIDYPGGSPSILPGFIPHSVYPYLIRGLIHLPGLRGNPLRTYSRSAAGPQFPGPFQVYVASILSKWKTEHDARLVELGATLEDMGLTWKVEAAPIDDANLELKVARLVRGKRGGAHDLVSIADVGFGVSQSLPVLVALLVARPGQILYLEQPEIHLHPRAQGRLAHALMRAANRGATVVVETHSALLLLEIQTLVAKGQLDASNVGLYWFKRGPDGDTTVSMADLDEFGRYGDWPEDFGETELQAERAYLDAATAKRAEK